MAEILLCNQPTRLSTLENQPGISTDNITGLSCVNPNILNSYTPYITEQNLSAADRDIMHLLSPMPVAKELTNLSLSFGEENILALSEISAKLKDYNIGLMGASTGLYVKRMGGFVGTIQNYQDALMQYRQTLKANPATKAVAKQKVMTAFQTMQTGFKQELNVVNAGVKSRKGTPLTSVTRGVNIARSSRNVAKLDVSTRVQAHNLVKFTQHAKFLGNGLALIELSSGMGNVYNSYKAGGDWERDLFIESSSFALSAGAGMLAANVGLSLLVFATPFGWAGLIIGGAVVAGASAGASIGMNYATKNNSGDLYDVFMNWVNTL